MLLAFAVLMLQSAALSTLLPSHSPEGTFSPIEIEKTDEIAATAANFQTNPALANLPMRRSFSSDLIMLQAAQKGAPVTDDSAAQNSTPAQPPVAQTVFPALQPSSSFMPGQLELVAAGESSSRADFSSAPASFKPAPYMRVSEAGRAHGLPRKWLILGGIEHGAATYDAWSTRRVIESGTGYETNPLLKPFASSNALYGAVQAAPFLFDYIGLRMLHSEHPWMRKFWWVPQSASTAASLFGGVHNTMMR
ncbi:MAG TPA: hypothetical protein VGZ48_01360 [Candidatus Acidoferrales bacterium]|jgi:hypothetical protein|nr:hypothetical protein [Candidatus Acidoferrales bacterium]